MTDPIQLFVASIAQKRQHAEKIARAMACRQRARSIFYAVYWPHGMDRADLDKYSDVDWTAEAWADRYMKAANALTAEGFRGPVFVQTVPVAGSEKQTDSFRTWRSRRAEPGEVVDEDSVNSGGWYEWLAPNATGEPRDMISFPEHGHIAALECWRLAFAGEREKLTRAIESIRADEAANADWQHRGLELVESLTGEKAMRLEGREKSILPVSSHGRSEATVAEDEEIIQAVRLRSEATTARRQAIVKAEEKQIRIAEAFSPIRNFGFHRGVSNPWRQSVDELRSLLLKLNEDLTAEGFGDWPTSLGIIGEPETSWVLDLLGEDHSRAGARLIALLEAAHPNLNDEPMFLAVLGFVRGIYHRFMPVFMQHYGDAFAPVIATDSSPRTAPDKDRWIEEPASLSELADWLDWLQNAGLPNVESGLGATPDGRRALQTGESWKESLELIKRHSRRLAGKFGPPVLPMTVKDYSELRDALDKAWTWCAAAIADGSEATTNPNEGNPFPPENNGGTTPPKLLTIWYHGEQSYSADNHMPVAVSAEEHGILQAFLESGAALTTRSLEKKVTNVARIVRQVAAKFPDAVRMPRKKGEGYFVCVKVAARG